MITLRRVAFGLVLLAWLLVLVKVAAPQLSQAFQPDGDLAADMLLVNQLRDDGYLLTGHYSRFGFNHPGPSFLYVNALFEQIGAVAGMPRANAWFLSSLVFNFVFLWLIAWATARLFGRRLSLAALAAVLPLSILLGSTLSNFWMPYRLVLPFAAFFLTAVLVASRGMRFLPLSMALACLLIHGYVTMPVFTLPLLLLVTLFRLWQADWRLAGDGRWLLISLGIGVLFLLPLLVDFLVNPQPNLLRILRAQSHLAGADHPTLAESLTYAFSYWRSTLLFLVPAALVFLLRSRSLGSVNRRPLLYAAALAAFISVVFVLYHATVPKPLHPFMGSYYQGIPLAMTALLLYASLCSLPRPGASVLLAGAMLVWLSTLQVQLMAPREDIRELGDFLIANSDQRVVIDYPDDSPLSWITAGGLLLYLKDKGVDACIARPELSFLYTAHGVCSGESATAYLEKAESCAATGCRFFSGEFALATPPLAETGDQVVFPACQLAHQETAVVGDDCRVEVRTPGWATFGPYVKLPAGRYRFEIDYASSLPRGQVAGQWDAVVDMGQTMLQLGSLWGTEGSRDQVSGEFLVGRDKQTEIRTRQDGSALLTIYGIRLKRLPVGEVAE